MKVILAVVGRLKEDYLLAAEAEYRKRLRPYCTLDVVEHKTIEALAAAIPAAAHVYAFDETGDLVTSHDLARDVLAAEELRGGGAPVWFLIGAADGLGDELRRRARRLFAFGRMTLAHRLVRILALEQLYRGFKIVRGEPYHRD